MVSAFLNTVKIPELRRRILFTLAIVVVVRLGAAITTPGVNQAVLQEWFRSALTEKSGGNLAALLNLFSGGALENCDLFARHHALHQRINYDAAAFGGHSAVGATRARRWRPTENHAIHAVHDRGAVHFSRLPARDFVPASGSIPRGVAGNLGDDCAAWHSAGRRSRMGFPGRDGHFAHDR